MNCKLFSQIIQCFSFLPDFRITDLSCFVAKVLCNSQVSSAPSRAVKHHFGTDRLESCKRLSCGSVIGLCSHVVFWGTNSRDHTSVPATRFFWQKYLVWLFPSNFARTGTLVCADLNTDLFMLSFTFFITACSWHGSILTKKTNKMREDRSCWWTW